MKIIENYNLKNHNTFGFEIFAKKFVEYNNEEELLNFLKNNSSEKKLHIGRGSNLLFRGDFDGTILHSNICHCEIERQSFDNQNNDVFVRVGAGVVWDDFVAQMVDRGFGGAENLSLIPGETGAAAVQNIGAYGVEFKNIISKVETIEIATLKKRIFDVSECKYGYRESIFKTDFKGKFIVTAVVFRLSKKPKLKLAYGTIIEYLQNIQNPNIQDVRDVIIKIRQSKLPDTKILGNAGSFFKNPYCSKEHFENLQKNYPNIPVFPQNEQLVKLSAAWLIEQCGWKGKTFGGAAVYHLQPLVLVNQGNATPQDVANLSFEIQKSVKEKFDIELEAEVNFI